jgi:tuftelin-interacting protein 11
LSCLGIWADDSGEEDDGSGGSRPSFRGAGGLSGKHNYSTPVSFVSGGVQQAGKQKAPKNNRDKIDVGDDGADDDGDEENDNDLDGKRGWNDTPNSSRCVRYLH